jgi:YHS domain-containing protein
MTRAISKPRWAVALLVALATGSAFTAHATEPASRAYLHSYNIPSTGLALEGYCPVAYFAVNKPVRGVPEFASTHNGVTYHFVNADAKKAFDAEPEKYVPAYGGWCAFGMAVSDKFPVDPTNFKIVDGRLMLFLKNKNVDALKLWNDGNEKDFVKKADAHWKTVTK